MTRSFTERIFGGICGGLAAALRVNVWAVRLVWALLALLSGGAFAVLYLLVWWLAPLDSPVARRRRRGIPLFMVFVLVALTAAAWAARDLGYLRLPTGTDLYTPLVALALSVVFFLRQLGG